MTSETARRPDPLLVRLGGVLEAVLNRALALDEQTRQRVGALEGRRIGVDLRGIVPALAIEVRAGRLRVGPHWQRSPDLNLRATPAALAAMALRRADTPARGRVEISGDAELARQLEQLARGFQPDLEEAFARAFGDVLGVPLARGLQRALTWGRESADALLRDTADYLRDERRELVATAEMEQFLDDVDALRERSERLEARVRDLAARLQGERR